MICLVGLFFQHLLCFFVGLVKEITYQMVELPSLSFPALFLKDPAKSSTLQNIKKKLGFGDQILPKSSPRRPKVVSRCLRGALLALKSLQTLSKRPLRRQNTSQDSQIPDKILSKTSLKHRKAYIVLVALARPVLRGLEIFILILFRAQIVQYKVPCPTST